MPRIQELLAGRDNRIDYADIKRRFSWIVSENKKCILSPDSDGLYYINLAIHNYFYFE